MDKQQAIDRLTQAWRGEVEARKVYEELALRQPDRRRADIVRQMADAEGRHRERIEARLRELGAKVPDPASVRLSAWTLLQTRIAPVERVLAAREAAEEAEIQVRYRQPTGDEETDRLLAEIRQEERGHERQVRSLRREEQGEQPKSPAEERLNRLQERETWHKKGTGWISGAIYGANDGLAAVFGIVSGMSGATGGNQYVLMAGLAGAVASALSMATGAYLAEKSEGEMSEANLHAEKREIEEHPEEEREELSLYYQLKGLSKQEADDLAAKLSRNQETFLQVLATEELGGVERDTHPGQAALSAGLSTGLGAIIPVLPFFWLGGMAGVITAAIVSLIAHFLVGAAKSLVTLRSWWAAGFEMTVAGIIVGAVTYVAGLLFHVG